MPKNIHVIRLNPGDDLRKSLQVFIDKNNFTAAWISTCVGSLIKYTIRFANQPEAAVGDGHFEIVSLTGTLSVNGSHLHISISDSTGKTIGGHLMEGCIVYTTAEIVLQSSDTLIFQRENDGNTGWQELKIDELFKRNDLPHGQLSSHNISMLNPGKEINIGIHALTLTLKTNPDEIFPGVNLTTIGI